MKYWVPFEIVMCQYMLIKYKSSAGVKKAYKFMIDDLFESDE